MSGILFVLVAGALAFEPVVEELDGGKVDWTAMKLLASAEGERTTGAMTDVEALEGSARSKLGPLMLDLAKQVRVTSTQDAGDLLDAGDAVADRLDSNLAIWEVYEVRYYTSGGVAMDGALPIQPWLRPALTARATGKDRPGGAAAAAITGLLVDARGLAVKPAVAPRLLDPNGEALYAAETLTVHAASQRGPVVWVSDPADPVAVRRAGESPLIVRAAAVRDGCDLVLAAEDAAKVRDAAAGASFLLNGQVAVVVGP